MENVTTPDQYELLEMNRISGFVNRAKGTGRPTKKTGATSTSSSLPNTATISILTSTLRTKKTNDQILKQKGRIIFSA